MAVFRLGTIRRWAADPQMKEMFRFPPHVDFSAATHVVLSSEGRFLASSDQSALQLLSAGRLQKISRPKETLLGKHRSLFELFDSNLADCLGFAATECGAPVLLQLELKQNEGGAKAIFHREPSRQNYELLTAVGIDYLGGQWTRAGFLASFRHRTPIHLHAAQLSNFERAGNCNRFFFNHGEIDSRIEAGLLNALRQRIAHAMENALQEARELARMATTNELAMTCLPPPPREPFLYGDLVPLGFLLSALDANARELCPEALHLQQKLIAAKQGPFWAFHTGRLVTATDSVLILQGVRDSGSVEALEHFSDGQGAYFPQLWSSTREPGRMAIRSANAHWCQPDFATTCLVRGLRAHFRLPSLTPLRYIEEHFESRSGLFFANPFLVDWALACAISSDENGEALRSRLRQEILGGMNPDYSFGKYDSTLSTSFAILALAALGCRGRLLCLAQARLAEEVDFPGGNSPEPVPFYSTRRVSNPAPDRNGAPQVIAPNGAVYELWLYRDTHRIISTAVAVMALAEASDPTHSDLHLCRSKKHPRYGCETAAEYIACFASPSFVLTDRRQSGGSS